MPASATCSACSTGLPREDARLGARRPEVVEALSDSIQHGSAQARQLRLLRDQWQIRRATYREYQRAIGSELLRLVKCEPSLEAIRRLAGPAPRRLVSASGQLDGGAERLQRLTSRRRFARPTTCWSARGASPRPRSIRATGRCQSGNVATAWEASSAAAGALLMVARVQAGDPRVARAPATSVITPRTTRLVRAADLARVSSALASLATGGIAPRRTPSTRRRADARRRRAPASIDRRPHAFAARRVVLPTS